MQIKEIALMLKFEDPPVILQEIQAVYRNFG